MKVVTASSTLLNKKNLLQYNKPSIIWARKQPCLLRIEDQITTTTYPPPIPPPQKKGEEDFGKELLH